MKWIANKPTLKKYIVQSAVGAGVFAVVLVLDLVSKFLTDGVRDLTVIPGFISFHSTYNTGGAWSLFSDNSVAMIIIMVFTFVFIAADLLVTYWPDGRKNAFFIVTLAFLGSGALGNLIDRLWLGYVRDFLRFDFITFPIFNVADVALVTGVIMLIVNIVIWFVRSEMKARAEKAAKGAACEAPDGSAPDGPADDGSADDGSADDAHTDGGPADGSPADSGPADGGDGK